MVAIHIKDMEGETPDETCKEVYCEFCKCNIKKLGWAKHLRLTKHIDNVNGVEKLKRNNVGNVDVGEYLNYIGEKIWHVIFVWGIGKIGQRRTLTKWRRWIRVIVKEKWRWNQRGKESV